MSFFGEVGNLVSRTSAGTDVITLSGSGASLDVKLVKLCMNGATATGGANADLLWAEGFSDGTNHRCVFGLSEDAAATSNTSCIQRNDAVLAIYNTSDGLIDFAVISATGTGTFTINWTTKSANAYRIGWCAWGGSGSAEVGSFTSKGSVGAQNITTTLKSANVGFFLGTRSATNTISTGLRICSGVSDSSVNQGALTIHSADASASANTFRAQSTTSAILMTTTTTVDDADVTAFDATNGIQLDWNTADATTREYFYALFKGGQWQVGNGETNTSTGNKSYTTLFQPEMMGNYNYHAAAGSTVHNRIGAGATDGTSQFSVCAVDDDAAPDMECGTDYRNDQCLVTLAGAQPSAAPTVRSLAAFGSFNATNFTLNTTDADNTLKLFFWYVCADVPAGAPDAGAAAYHYFVIQGAY